MPNYRRAIAPGGTLFFTVVSWRRRPILCNADIRASLREAMTTTRSIHPFAIDALVLLPDHLHCVWTLPAGDTDFAVRWAMIKRHVTRRCGRHYPIKGCIPASRRARNEGTIWQRRFWEHQVRDPADWVRCLDYLHWNPVKHGHVGAVRDWPFSSFHHYVRQGQYPRDWGGPATDTRDEEGFGE